MTQLLQGRPGTKSETKSPAESLLPVKPPIVDVEAARRSANGNKSHNFTPLPDIKARLNATQTQDNGGGYVSERHNSTGGDVKFWQEQLKAWALTQGGETAAKYQNMTITDSFAANPAFTQLIKDFQSANNLSVDGIIGPRTFRAFAQKHFDASYGAGSFQTYTGVSILEEAAYLALLEESKIRRKSSYSENLPLPKAIDAKTILSDPEKVAAFQALMNSKAAKGNQVPITAKRFLELCVEYNFDPSLALAQAIQESHIGTNGERPISTRNIFNVGNVDSGANRQMGGWEEGMRAYLELMTTSYGNSADNVLKRDFQRLDGGGRYATSSRYYSDIRSLVGEVRQALGAETDYTEFYAKLKAQGGGLVKFDEPQDIQRMNPLLLSTLNQAAIELGFNQIFVSCSITGHSPFTTSGHPSRHMKGLAVDIATIDGVACNVNNRVGKEKAERLVAWLKQNGFSTREYGNERAVLWGFNDPSRGGNHNNHIHVSMKA